MSLTLTPRSDAGERKVYGKQSAVGRQKDAADEIARRICLPADVPELLELDDSEKAKTASEREVEQESWPYGWRESNPAFVKAYGNGSSFAWLERLTAQVLGLGRLAKIAQPI